MLFSLSFYRIFILFLFILSLVCKNSKVEHQNISFEPKIKEARVNHIWKKKKSSICCIHWLKVTFSIIIGCVFTSYTYMQQDFFFKKRPKIQWLIGDELLHYFNMFSLHNQSIPRSFIIFLVINLKKKKNPRQTNTLKSSI